MNIVQKRKASILKKREKKESSKAKYHSKREDKYILQAGDAFSKEKDVIGSKFKPIMQNDVTRGRKVDKRESKALGEMFKESYFDGQDLTYKCKDELDEFFVVVPNYTNIKSRISSVLDREFNNIGPKLQLLSFVTIKYLVISDVYNLKKVVDEEEFLKKDILKIHYFNSSTTVIHARNVVEQFTNQVCEEFALELEDMKGPSGMVLYSIRKLSVKTCKQKQVFGKSFLELPVDIKAKKACVNIKNMDDDKCFLWSLLAAKYYDTITNKDKNEVRYYKKYAHEIVEPKIFEYPVKITDIPEFERLNNLRINVFVLDEVTTIRPAYKSEMDFKLSFVNLLLIENEENSHYVWIKDLSRLASSKTTRHKKHFCNHCWRDFDNEKKLFFHLKYCGIENCNVELPAEGKNTTKFINYGKEFMHPFHVVADFESTLEKVDEEKEGKTNKYQKHVQNSYGLKYNCIHEEYSEDVKIMSSSDPEKVNISFIEDLESLAKKSYELLQQNKHNIIMTNEQKASHGVCNTCSKCKNDCKDDKVKHHDHITGQFISTLCSKCNLELKYERFLPVYIHNLKGYDSHLFVTSLYQYGYQADKNDNITCIPNNEERYISFSKHIQVDEVVVYDKEIKRKVI